MRLPKFRFMMLGLTLLSSAILPFYAADGENYTPKVLITLQRVGTKMKPLRPKAPDRQVVTCAYDGESLHLTFIIPEGSATLSVTDETLLSSTYGIDTTTLAMSIPVGELVGTVSIELETEAGNSYNGIFE